MIRVKSVENLDTVVEKLMVKVSEFKKEAHSAGLEKVNCVWVEHVL